MKTLFSFLFCLLCLGSMAQSKYYWVKFTDKSFGPYSVSMPGAYLSRAAVERRQKQNIAVDETDLPINPEYLNTIRPFVTRIVHSIKWFNIAVVEMDTTMYIENLRDMNYYFIAGIGPIEDNPTGKTDFENKFNEVFEPVDQAIVYPNKYGIAYRQTNMLSTDLLHQMGYRGAGITIATMDNGYLGVDSMKGFDSVRANIIATRDFVHGDTLVYDEGTHGTATFSCMAGNIPNKYLGTAPDAKYYLLHTEESNKEWIMEEYNWVAAAEWADSAGAQLFSTSLGYTTFSTGGGSHTYADLTGDKTLITRAANMAFNKGILVINSAGNEGAPGNAWHYINAPADGRNVMAVGAVDSAKRVANFSSWGPTAGDSSRIKPDVCAQGERSGVINFLGEISFSGGTSFSCPTLAGSAASLWGAFPDKSAREIFDAIMISTDSFWSPNVRYGYGVPNFYTAYLLLKTGYNQNIIKVGEDATIFPNPFNNAFNVSLYHRSDKPRIIELYNMDGQLLFTKAIYLRENSYQILTIEEAQNLAPGTYVLIVDGEKKFAHKIVKQ